LLDVAQNGKLQPGRGAVVRGKSKGATFMAFYRPQHAPTRDGIRAMVTQVLVDADAYQCFAMAYYMPTDQATESFTVDDIIETTTMCFVKFLQSSSVRQVYLVGGFEEHNELIQQVARTGKTPRCLSWTK
jgi:hypothetical protein